MRRRYSKLKASELTHSALESNDINTVKELRDEARLRTTSAGRSARAEIQKHLNKLEKEETSENFAKIGRILIEQGILSKLQETIDFLRTEKENLEEELHQAENWLKVEYGDTLVLEAADEPKRQQICHIFPRESDPRRDSTVESDGSLSVYAGTWAARNLLGAILGDTVNISNEREWNLIKINKNEEFRKSNQFLYSSIRKSNDINLSNGL